MEVETPMLVSNAGGAAARPFETHYNALDEDVKLRISLELYLKRLIVGGYGARLRDRPCVPQRGRRYPPQPGVHRSWSCIRPIPIINGMMDLTENMYRYVAQKVLRQLRPSPITACKIDLGKPFERMTMIEAVKKYSGVDFNDIRRPTRKPEQLAKEHHVEFEERHTKGDILNLFFEEFVEEQLIQPTFIMDHPDRDLPADQEEARGSGLWWSALSSSSNGCEYGNAYSELNDPIDQRERFERTGRAVGHGRRLKPTTPMRTSSTRWRSACPQPAASASVSTAWSCC